MCAKRLIGWCRCKKLPKGLKDWQAYIDLKQKIDDFSECCPLLEMMSNKAMQRRHWDRISSLTGYTFDVENENFLLRHVMEAPLLKFKDDIEVLLKVKGNKSLGNRRDCKTAPCSL